MGPLQYPGSQHQPVPRHCGRRGRRALLGGWAGDRGSYRRWDRELHLPIRGRGHHPGNKRRLLRVRKKLGVPLVYRGRHGQPCQLRGENLRIHDRVHAGSVSRGHITSVHPLRPRCTNGIPPRHVHPRQDRPLCCRLAVSPCLHLAHTSTRACFAVIAHWLQTPAPTPDLDCAVLLCPRVGHTHLPQL